MGSKHNGARPLCCRPPAALDNGNGYEATTGFLNTFPSVWERDLRALAAYGASGASKFLRMTSE